MVITVGCLWFVRSGASGGGRGRLARILSASVGAAAGTVLGYHLGVLAVLLTFPSFSWGARSMSWIERAQPPFPSWSWALLEIRSAVALYPDTVAQTFAAGLFAAIVPALAPLRVTTALAVVFAVSVVVHFSGNILMWSHPVQAVAGKYGLLALVLWLGGATGFGLLVLARNIAGKLALRWAAGWGPRRGTGIR